MAGYSRRKDGTGGGCKRVGHGGASAVVRGNTIASFDAALEIGVDMIEFDVRPRGGRLVVAHTGLDALLREALPLERALAHLSQPRFDAIELNVDVKVPGSEAAALYLLRRFDLLDRSLVSSHLPIVLDRVRALEPRVRTGISVGNRLARRRQGWGDWRERVLDALGAGRFSALMAHHPLVDGTLVAAVRELGAEVYAWTVDERGEIDRLAELEVTGITTGDPRLFATT